MARTTNWETKHRNETVMNTLEEILQTHNPCRIVVMNGKATCGDGTPCCTGCRFKGPTGCTTNSPACKFYFCPTAWNSLPETAQQQIRNLGEQYTGVLRERKIGRKMTRQAPFIY